MPEEKLIPQPIRLAQETLARLRAEDPAAAGALKGFLGAFALRLAKGLRPLSAEILLDHARRGEAHMRAVQTGGMTKPKRRTYARIAAKLTHVQGNPYAGLKDIYDKLNLALQRSDLAAIRRWRRQGLIGDPVQPQEPLLKWAQRTWEHHGGTHDIRHIEAGIFRRGNMRVVRYFCEAPGAQPDQALAADITYHAQYGSGRLNVLKYAHRRGADLHKNDDMLMMGALQMPALFKYLYRHGADPRRGNVADMIGAHKGDNDLDPDYIKTMAWLEARAPAEGRLSSAQQDAVNKYNARRGLWRKAAGCAPPEGIADTELPRFRWDAFRLILRALAAEGYWAERYHEQTVNRMAHNAAALFGTGENVLRYLEKWGRPGKQPLHDLIQMIELPEKIAPVSADWCAAVLACGPSMAGLVKFSDKTPSPARSRDGRTWSMINTRVLVAKNAFNRAAENAPLAALCLQLRVTGTVFDKALDFMRENPPAKKNIPDISIDGAAFDMPGARFYRLPEGDARALFFGNMVDCCQRIGGEGAACARHSYTSPDGGLYVVENAKGRIVSGAWGWRGDGGELCLDSIETLGDNVTDAQWEKILRGGARDIENGANGVTALTVGTGGGTPKALLRAFGLARDPAEPVDYRGYRDSNLQLLVWKKGEGFAPGMS